MKSKLGDDARLNPMLEVVTEHLPALKENIVKIIKDLT